MVRITWFLCDLNKFFLCFSVLELKHAIQAKYKIAIQHQVLVVNGGECMAAERRVCSYSAGTVRFNLLVCILCGLKVLRLAFVTNISNVFTLDL